MNPALEVLRESREGFSPRRILAPPLSGINRCESSPVGVFRYRTPIVLDAALLWAAMNAPLFQGRLLWHHNSMAVIVLRNAREPERNNYQRPGNSNSWRSRKPCQSFDVVGLQRDLLHILLDHSIQLPTTVGWGQAFGYSIRLCTSNSVFLRVVVTNSPQLIKVRDLNDCHGDQTKFWTLPYMVATESPTVIAFK